MSVTERNFYKIARYVNFHWMGRTSSKQVPQALSGEINELDALGGHVHAPEQDGSRNNKISRLIFQAAVRGETDVKRVFFANERNVLGRNPESVIIHDHFGGQTHNGAPTRLERS